MPRGGRRVGAGRKPKGARAHWLTGDAGKRNLSLVEAPADAGQTRTAAVVTPLGPPGVLSEAERAYWVLWEPLARENGTLTPATCPGFVLLCQTAVDFTAARARMHTDPDDAKVRSHYRGLLLRVEQELARYGLASMGPPKATVKPKADDDRDTLRRLLAVT